MANIELHVEPRTLTGKKVRNLRNAGIVPGVLYGRGIESVNIKCEERTLSKTLSAAGYSNLITLQIGDGQKTQVLLRDVQYEPLTQRVQHVDFYQVIMTETVTTEVSIELIGEATGPGIIVQDMNEVTIECLPGDLFDSIQVDLENLAEIGQTVTVKDLQVPESVTLMAGEDDLVAHVEAPHEEPVEEVEEAILGVDVDVEPALVDDETEADEAA